MLLGWQHIRLVLAIVAVLAYGQNTTTTSASNATTTTAPSLAPTDCHCGFIDPNTTRVYTDSLIVYFNETQKVPEDAFSVSSFEHPYEIGWTIFYREGATPSNVYYQNGTSWAINNGWLNMNVSGYTPEHLVNGAEIKSIRQDMLYGSFRVFMQPPVPYASGGSSLTMRLEYNETSSAELDLMNMDDSTDAAWMGATVANLDPELSEGFNFTVLEANYTTMWPWNFLEYRMDWDEDTIDWYYGVNKVRTNATSDATLVDIPTGLTLKHWSNGDANFMQGPPTNNSGAQIGYVRAFFNSSVDPKDIQTGCIGDQRCSTEDFTVRVSTPYGQKSTVPLAADVPSALSRSKTVAIAIVIASLTFSAALLIHALVRRAFVKRVLPAASAWVNSPQKSDSDFELSKLSANNASYNASNNGSYDASRNASSTNLLSSTGNNGNPGFLRKNNRSISQRPLLNRDSWTDTQTTFGAQTPGLTPLQTPAFELWDPISGKVATSPAPTDSPGEPSYVVYSSSQQNPDLAASGLQARGTTAAGATAAMRKEVAQTERDTEGAVAAANPGAKPPAPAAGQVPQARTRVDYLAGLVAVCSLLVSCTHFILTFVPSVIMEYLPMHYNSEYWARRTIEPFFFNEIWVGLFFTTSTRFLVTGYLRNGSLKGVAEKIVCRTPRLMIPITAVILFEYFLMDLGATKYLEYIPSITWSTWPSTTLYTNFGWFINETLQLIYLIPNAAPQLTWNFCTGVLWTIPVQLQNTWVVILGVVVVKEIKTPWKRFGFYAFCIINHWYALSWGYYFWAGLLMADLDITFKWRKGIQSKAYIHYPMLTLACILVFCSLGNDLLSVWTGWTFGTEERSLHPEPQSALPLGQTALAGYPEYTEPKLNGFVFCVAAQYIVEFSIWVQKFLSTKPFLLLFPHVFTIYLIHGLIFWTVGSMACVYFAGLGYAYWLNMLLTALISYATLFAALPIVTPVMEMLGKEMTKSVWVAASEEPVEWRPTSWPLSREEVANSVCELERRSVR